MGNYSKEELLSSAPILFNGKLKVYKPTLREIFDVIGLKNYDRQTSLITMSSFDIQDFMKKNNIEGDIPTPLKFVISIASYNPANFLEIQSCFFTYLKKPVEIINNTIVVKQDNSQDFIFDDNSFIDFQELILMINQNLEPEEEREIITNDEKMRQKFLKARAKLREAKRKQRQKEALNGEGISLSDIISSLCTYRVGYNLINVWDLTIYQLYEHFKKCQAQDEYEHNYQALLAGADSKKIKLKSWFKT